MSASATSLESISDDGVFESLATAVLRRTRQDCASVIHTGVNADGKPVPSPVDGIAIVPGSSPRRFIMLQHTTIARPKLGEKWLGEAGDIAKAIVSISRERERTPHARLTLILTTNRVPSPSLILDVSEKTLAADIEVDIWDQSRLADFLDHDPDGQWLRKTYLGIDQQRLSAELLADLSTRSLQSLRATVLDDPAAWVDRTLDGDLMARVRRNETITFLVMPSGTGKTTAVAQLLWRWIESGHFGFWVPPQAIENAMTLDQAIDSVLRSYEPTLESNSAAVARTVDAGDGPLLLIVDDVNRSPRPTALVERLATWTVPRRESGDSDTASERRVHVVCPVWPQTVEQISESARRFVMAHSILDGVFAPAEAIAAVRRRAAIGGKDLSEVKAKEVSGLLGNDPLLIALAPEVQAGRSPHRIISSFIADQVKACASLLSGSFIAADYDRALGALAREMLARRDLTPRWDDVTAWFADDSVTLGSLRNLFRQRTLCHIEGSIPHECAIFRHDRVRNVILGSELNRRMATDDLSEDVLSDPYYAEALGLAIVLEVVPWCWIDRLASRNPLALVHALRTFQQPSTDFERKIVSTITSWLDAHVADRATQHLRWAIQATLANVDAPVVLEICKHFAESSHMLAQARFRNGDIRSGATFCYNFEPHLNASFRDELIRHTQAAFGSKLVEDLRGLLLNPQLPPKLRMGALYLAGFLADASLINSIAACWNNFGRTPEFLPAFVWAGCQCARELSAPLLDPIFDYWGSLPDCDDNDRTKPHRFMVVDEMGAAFHRSPPTALAYLIAQAERPELRSPISLLLDYMDHPKAVEFIARERARVARESEGTDLLYPWLSDSGMRAKHPLGNESRELLRTLWENEFADRHLRERAFEIWALNATRDDTSRAQSIDAESVLFDRALRLRIKLRDPSAVPAFREKIQTARHRSYWWQFARDFWCGQLTEQLDEELGQRGRECSPCWDEPHYETDWIVAELMAGLDPATAERLLVKHWSHLRYEPQFVQTALFVATEKCRSLAKESIKQSPDPRKLLQYIDHHWHIGGTEQRGRLVAERLAAIEPYLDLLEEMPILSIWTACNLDGFYEWRRKHLDHRIAEKYRDRHGTSDMDLFAHLDGLAEKGGPRWLDHWLDEFDERGDPAGRALAIVREWLMARKTMQAYEIAAECIVLRGRRADVDILAIPGLPNASEAVAIRTDTRFAVFNRTLV
jgi:hypothetical protein